MRKISSWAKQHPFSARVMIVALYFPLNILGIIAGYFLADEGVFLPAAFFYSVLFLFLLAVVHYKKAGYYYARKLADFTLGFFTFLMICFYGNLRNSPPAPAPFNHATGAMHLVNTIQSVTVEQDDATNKDTKKQQKQVFKKKKKISKGWKVVLIILTISGAIGLLILLAALSCSLACNGAEGLAFAVGILGTVGILFLAYRIIRRISKGPRKPKEDATGNTSAQ
jgi:hypothetical protein